MTTDITTITGESEREAIDAPGRTDRPMPFLLPVGIYIASRRCPTCKAEPWTPCTGSPTLGAGKPRTAAHAKRIDAGIWHQRKDVRRAPWIEERKVGTCYSTVTVPDAVLDEWSAQLDDDLAEDTKRHAETVARFARSDESATTPQPTVVGT